MTLPSTLPSLSSRDTDPATAPVLRLAGVDAGYGRTTVLRDVSISVPAGRILALLGPNGAGKTTLLRTAAGVLRPTAGQVLIDGKDLTKAAPHRRARAGLCLIPEGRGIFPSLTVRENLRIQVPTWRKDKAADSALDVFPILRERLSQTAGTMSGGQQQMLALARAYLSGPRVVLLDEVSMGLAPKVVDEIFETIHNLAATGLSLVLVEQYVHRALELAHDVVLLDRGTVAFAGPADSLDQAAVLRGYLGIGHDETSQVPTGPDVASVAHTA
jgi:branched-chain amino acid transport system ATP-binding protein